MMRYDKYKPSSVVWIDDIPVHWDLIKLKYLAYFEKGKNAATYTNEYIGRNWGEYPVYSGQTENEGVLGAIDTYDYDLHNALLVTTVGAKAMSLRKLPQKFSLSQNCALIVNRDDRFNVQFFYYYLLQHFEYEKGLISLIMQPSLRFEDLNRYDVYLPAPEEQVAIANFLDEKTQQIDMLIANKQKLIEFLQEERTAIINQAVTRGIDPNVKLKPSGIDWLGDIPAHWEVKKLKYVAKMQGGFAFNSDDFVAEGIQLIKIGNLYKNEFSLDRQPTFLPIHYANEYKDWLVQTGDILISMTGTLGKRDYGYAIQIKDTDEVFLLNQRVSKVIFRKSKVIDKFGLHILQSNYYLDQLFLLPSGTKQGNLSNEQALSLTVIFPAELKEQIAIVQYIQTEIHRIDRTVSNIKREMELLQEYRTALISEVVTGKIKVT